MQGTSTMLYDDDKSGQASADTPTYTFYYGIPHVVPPAQTAAAAAGTVITEDPTAKTSTTTNVVLPESTPSKPEQIFTDKPATLPDGVCV